MQMEEGRNKEPMVMVRTAEPCEETEEGCDYVTVNFEDWSYYIWGCQELTPFLKDEGGSMIKDAAIQINDLLTTIKSRGKIQPKGMSMKAKMKNWTEEELEEVADASLKELKEIVDLNLVKDRMNNVLQIDKREPDEEEKCIADSSLSTQRMNWAPVNIMNENSEI